MVSVSTLQKTKLPLAFYFFQVNVRFLENVKQFLKL